MEEIVISLDDLDLGECEKLEEATGISVEDLDRYRIRELQEIEDEAEREAEAAKPGLPVKVVTALLWLAKLRDDPEYTLEKARKMRPTRFKFKAPENPTEGGS